VEETAGFAENKETIEASEKRACWQSCYSGQDDDLFSDFSAKQARQMWSERAPWHPLERWPLPQR